MHGVLEAGITFKKCSIVGTFFSGLPAYFRVKRRQERKNRLGKSFFMLISFSHVKMGVSCLLKIGLHHLFLLPAPKRTNLEYWGWCHLKALFL